MRWLHSPVLVNVALAILSVSIYRTDAQDGIIFGQEEGSGCQLANGGNGVCKIDSSCPEAYKNFPAERPVICTFQGTSPVVCCPPTTEPVTGDPDVVIDLRDISAPRVSFACGNSEERVVYFPFSFDSQDYVDTEPFSPPVDQVGLPPTDYSPDYPSFNVTGFEVAYSVGGEDARFVLAKYSVLVGFQDTAGVNDWFCTGVLLNQFWVLTAAHCPARREINVVRFGEHDYNDENDGAEPIDMKVVSIVLHPEYASPQGYHDLALLKVARQIPFGEFINPVCLPWGTASDKSILNEQITVTGWGATEFNGLGSSILQEVNVTIFPVSQCQQSYSQLGGYDRVWPRDMSDDIICAGDPEGGKDACQGDSGGPVVYLNAARQFVLAGVVSSGYGCGLKEYPGIYVNMHHKPYLAWIKRVAFSS